ncbi:hypothetical protein DQ04_02721000 [Trypanosoma grayi]|uniref:hypothetical protein n=1 Tax=Trypanosoma grayi TaxID=71804 RepID=UPI0004F4B29C|nr:hypothetical protein DQ04_02721000 [Trypanosoma grayi]KEG11341.1 hypothetical protein DQ04_02721000 [Trypanosoma grayi]
MEIVRRISSCVDGGHLFDFTLDEASPHEPEMVRVHHYYVVSTDQSSAHAYCYLSTRLCPRDVDAVLSSWLTLYCRVFGVTTYERFLEMRHSISNSSTEGYALFASETVARAALRAVASSGARALSKRFDNEALTHLVQTPRDAEAGDLASPPLYDDWRSCVDEEKLVGATPALTEEGRELLEDRLHKSQLLLQAERCRREADVAALRDTIDGLKREIDNLVQGHKNQLHDCVVEQRNALLRLESDVKNRESELQRTHSAAVEEWVRLLKQSTQENRSLAQRHNEACIELERWRIECQQLRHRLNATRATATRPIDSVSREQYNDLERRHHLLHKEFDELSVEKTDMEQQLQKVHHDLCLRSRELERALQVLNSLGKGLDYVWRELPLVCESSATYAA